MLYYALQACTSILYYTLVVQETRLQLELESRRAAARCAAARHARASAQSLMNMLRRVENEKFTFKIDTEITLVDCASGTLGPTVELAS